MKIALVVLVNLAALALDGSLARRHLRESDSEAEANAWTVEDVKDEYYEGEKHKIVARTAIRNEKQRWPNKIVSYRFKDDFSKKQTAIVKIAMDEWERLTCLNFTEVPEGFKENHIRIIMGEGCWSYTGMTSWKGQDLSLGKEYLTGEGCFFHYKVIHQIGHAIGLVNEETRPDRDDYVTVLTENVLDNYVSGFQKFSSSYINTYDVPYDYRSVMQSDEMARSKNGNATIIAKDPEFQSILGNKKGLSFYDIMLVNRMYGCSDHCDTTFECPPDSYKGKDCGCYCKRPASPIGSRQCVSPPTTTTTTTTTTPTPTTKKPCKNQIPGNLCKLFAKRGYCKKNSKYYGVVSQLCARKCKVCKK